MRISAVCLRHEILRFHQTTDCKMQNSNVLAVHPGPPDGEPLRTTPALSPTHPPPVNPNDSIFPLFRPPPFFQPLEKRPPGARHPARSPLRQESGQRPFRRPPRHPPPITSLRHGEEISRICAFEMHYPIIILAFQRHCLVKCAARRSCSCLITSKSSRNKRKTWTAC